MDEITLQQVVRPKRCGEVTRSCGKVRKSPWSGLCTDVAG